MQGTQYTRLFDHSHWATLRVARLMSQLPQETLEADSTRFYQGSAWEMLRHIVDVEWSWLRCCQGLDVKGWVWDAYPLGDMTEMLAFLAEEYPRVHDYVAGLDQAALDEQININGPDETAQYLRRGDLLMHIFNHGVEHRGDLAHFLTDHNLSPGDLDYIDWYLHTQ